VAHVPGADEDDVVRLHVADGVVTNADPRPPAPDQPVAA
jgi:hypothetical protein